MACYMRVGRVATEMRECARDGCMRRHFTNRAKRTVRRGVNNLRDSMEGIADEYATVPTRP